MSLMQNLPSDELPRERLLQKGPLALSLQELIAILLRTGTTGKSVLVLAQELLLQFGGLEGLLAASIQELTAHKGIGKAKAVTLKAALGIAIKSAEIASKQDKPFLSLEQIALLAKEEMGHLKKEAFLVLLFDVRMRLIHQEIISLGTLSQVLIHPREVFEVAIRNRANSLVVCHNHPSGDPTPSQEDLELTEQLCKCAELLKIPLIDHLIIGRSYHVSLMNSSSLTS